MDTVKIAVIGLGYVGLPLARLVSTKYKTVGFDMNKSRVNALMACLLYTSCAQLNNIKEDKARCYGNLTVSEVYEYDIDSRPEELDAYCSVSYTHLASTPRPSPC